MNFFAEQRTRTQRSLLLYGLFLLIVLAHMVVALGVMSLLLTIFTGGIYHWALVLVTIWTGFSFVAGSFLEYRRLKAGGRAIAQRVGAVRLFIDNSQEAWEHSRGVAHQHEPVSPVQYTERHIAVRDERDFPPVYRRYYEFSQQLAIASGLSTPILYVLPNEQGINGFVAGRHTKDMVLVVTQGALDKLSDEALYGLIGHEYGHILHGDAKFNLQLMVLLAGLQLLYDWSASVNNFGSNSQNNYHNYFDEAVNQKNPLSQRAIDNQARSTEAKTANFTTHAEWVTYWQAQAQHSTAPHKNSAFSSSSSSSLALDRNAPRSVWTLLLHGLSFSSMASAQLIKHSFNRERELLADATSVQLTRSPAILETLKAIHQDSLGSRLSGIADINGLSHFFFASSGNDLSDVSWFATHPSLSERMSAINANEYQSFAVQVATQKRLNQQKIKEIYEQRRSGTWGELKQNSLSKNTNTKQQLPPIVHKEDNLSTKKIIDHRTSAINDNSSNNLNVEVGNEEVGIEKVDIEVKSDITSEFEKVGESSAQTDIETDARLEFTIEADVIIDGRLQVESSAIGTYKVLQPWQAAPNSNLPTDTLMSDIDIQQAALPNYVLNHSHHPLGAQALIETVMLCHQGRILSTTAIYNLTDIWCEPCKTIAITDQSTNDNDNNHKLLPHTIDCQLLETIAGLDRRLDSALIALTLKHLRRHDLSLAAIEQLHQQSLTSHTHTTHQHYQQQQKCRTMLMRYQQGLIEVFNRQLAADLTSNLSDDLIDNVDSNLSTDEDKELITYLSSLSLSEARQSPILSLWQALHLQQLLPVLSQVLGNDCENPSIESVSENVPYQQVLQAGVPNIISQLDPSGQIFQNLNVAEQMMLIIVAYRLAKNIVGKDKVRQTAAFIDTRSLINKYKNYIMDLRRHARLIDIDLGSVSDANLHWLLLTAQNLNSIQLLAIISLVETAEVLMADNNQHKARQDSGQIAYNGYADSSYRLWLSTLHTVMLHDTIVSQDEYDCLTVLAERWLGVRQLFD